MIKATVTALTTRAAVLLAGMCRRLSMADARYHRSASAILMALAIAAPSVEATAQSNPAWQQSNNLGGGLEAGTSLALSADGNVAVVGGPGTTVLLAFGGAAVSLRRDGSWFRVGNLQNLPYTDFGRSVAVSGDGMRVLVGAPGGTAGAAVFTGGSTRDNWTLETVLAASNQIGTPRLGTAVALSGDGTTAAVGGAADNSNAGAVWISQWTSGSWAEQAKLTVSDSVGVAQVGSAVALSADGNTLAVGGPSDANGLGATWVFTRLNGVWSQQGGKLVGSGGSVGKKQGASVALSTDGSTMLIGASGGGAWIFQRTQQGWAQQGPALASSSGSQPAFGTSVALSGNGRRAMIGSPPNGAIWFEQTKGVWTEQAPALLATGATATADQGMAVALSANGLMTLIGAPHNNYVQTQHCNGCYNGGAWPFAFIRSASHDFNADGKSDIAWRNSSGNNAMWLMNGATIASVERFVDVSTNWYIVGQRDFNGDGKTDLLWANTTGDVAIWLMNGSTIVSVASLGNVGANWGVAGTGDFDGDGKGDILWRSIAGDNAIWFMNGTTLSSIAGLGKIPTNWAIAGTADFDGDGKSDVIWRNVAGDNAIWFMNGATISSVAGLGNVPTNWSIVGTADFDADNKSDILWRNSAGDDAIWFMNGGSISSIAGLGNIPTNWSIVSNGDYNGDGNSDILWRNTAGDNAVWFMTGTTISSVAGLGNVPTNWTIQNMNAN